MTYDAQQEQESIQSPSKPPNELAGEVLPVSSSVAEVANNSRITTPPGAEVDTLNEVRQEFTRHIHDYVNEYVRFADEKAAVVATFASAMLAFLHTQELLPALGLELSIAGVFRFLAPMGLGLSILLAMLVVLPQRGGDSSGLVFWGAIAAKSSAKTYESYLRGASPEALDSALVQHTHEVSVICRTKYRRLAWAMYVGFAGILASVSLILMDH
jgi:pycsar effector protein